LVAWLPVGLGLAWVVGDVLLIIAGIGAGDLVTRGVAGGLALLVLVGGIRRTGLGVGARTLGLVRGWLVARGGLAVGVLPLRGVPLALGVVGGGLLVLVLVAGLLWILGVRLLPVAHGFGELVEGLAVLLVQLGVGLLLLVVARAGVGILPRLLVFSLRLIGLIGRLAVGGLGL
jgi:hypothetical protein